MKILDALKESKELMMGHKGELFVFHLSFIGHAFLIIITFGLYALYFMPYFATADTNYYLHLTRQKRIEEQKYVENTEYGFRENFFPLFIFKIVYLWYNNKYNSSFKIRVKTFNEMSIRL